MYPYTLYALHLAGADEIYNLGGVQAMASMVHGCLGMQPVDMITGAGNAFVAESKRQLFGQVGIDLLADLLNSGLDLVGRNKDSGGRHGVLRLYNTSSGA